MSTPATADIKENPGKLIVAGLIVLAGAGAGFLYNQITRKDSPTSDSDSTVNKPSIEEELKRTPALQKGVFALIIILTITSSILLILLHFRQQLFAERVVNGRLFV